MDNQGTDNCPIRAPYNLFARSARNLSIKDLDSYSMEASHDLIERSVRSLSIKDLSSYFKETPQQLFIILTPEFWDLHLEEWSLEYRMMCAGGAIYYTHSSDFVDLLLLFPRKVDKKVLVNISSSIVASGCSLMVVANDLADKRSDLALVIFSFFVEKDVIFYKMINDYYPKLNRLITEDV